jgi:hypothetical protein
MGDPATGQSITMAPLVVRNKVFVGNSGGEFGILINEPSNTLRSRIRARPTRHGTCGTASTPSKQEYTHEASV